MRVIAAELEGNKNQVCVTRFITFVRSSFIEGSTMHIPRFLCIALVTLAGVIDVPKGTQAAQQPNILHIVADDLGWKDVGYHGSDISTPSIDSLAANGIRLESFYAQPMCTPTRACLMTGRYPFRYGLQTAVIPSGHTYGLPTDEYLLPQALKAVGYTTAIIGKWHLGHADQKYWPRQRGFDYQYGPLIGEIDYFTHEQHHVLDWYKNNEPLNEQGYSTTLIGNDAVRFITEHNTNNPLYLYLTFNSPHTPYQAPQEYLDKYKHISDPSRRAYSAMINAMDDQIGRVVAALEKKGMRENTLILFQSDNGGTKNKMFAGEGDMTNINIPCDNGPYREGKGSLYEGGTRVCALANWPGKIQPGATNELIHVVDLYPTIAHLACAMPKADKPLDGVNIWNTISQGSPSPRTEIIYNIEPFRAAVRQGDWKLVWRTPLPESIELYNLKSDPSETTDMSHQQPEMVASLKARASELSRTMAKPLLLETEFKAVLERLAMPPALPSSN